MSDIDATRARGTVHDLSDVLTAALAAAAGRVGEAGGDDYLRALALARTARTEVEIRAAIEAVQAVGTSRQANPGP